LSTKGKGRKTSRVFFATIPKRGKKENKRKAPRSRSHLHGVLGRRGTPSKRKKEAASHHRSLRDRKGKRKKRARAATSRYQEREGKDNLERRKRKVACAVRAKAERKKKKPGLPESRP